MKNYLWMIFFVFVAMSQSLSFAADMTEKEKIEQTEYWFSKGKEFYSAGEYKKAIEAYTKATSIDTGHIPSLYSKGLAYSAISDYDKAIESFTEVIEKDGKFLAAYFSRGFNYAEKGDYEKAIKDMGKVAELDPNFAPALCGMG